jgi:predicted HicB family RNase H-like nuclease
MKAIQVRLPDHLHEKLKDLVKEEDISLNNFIVASISNEVVYQETRDLFKKAAVNFNS